MLQREDQKKTNAKGRVPATDISLGRMEEFAKFLVKKHFDFEGLISNVDLGLF